MYYIFKNNGECIASCNNKPNTDDLESRDEIAVESNENYNITKIKLYNGNIVVVEPTQAEKNQAQANTAKAELRSLAEKAMMAQLAGGDIAAQQAAYQSNIATLSDDVALLIPEVYPVWSGNGVEYKKDMRVTYNSVLYKVLQDHTSQETWTPTDAPSLFVKVLTSSESILEWEQPTAENAYMKGDRVKYNGKVYESLIDNNVWSPEGYPAGWKLIEE